MRKLIDELEIDSSPEGTSVTLVRTLPELAGGRERYDT